MNKRSEPSRTRLVLGVQPAREAIAVHGAALRVLVEARPRDAEQLEAVARFARDRGATVDRVDRGTLDRLAEGERHQGVIVEAPPLVLLDEDALTLGEEGSVPLLIALDELTDPHNFGAIVRTAVALGATGVIFPEDKSAPLSPAMTRASAGAVEHARLCRVQSLHRTLERLTENAVETIALDASGTEPIDALTLTVPVCLVVGAEGKGLRRSTRRACSKVAKLPMRGPIGSLNASVAAAIALYEVVRQRARHEVR